MVLHMLVITVSPPLSPHRMPISLFGPLLIVDYYALGPRRAGERLSEELALMLLHRQATGVQ